MALRYGIGKRRRSNKPAPSPFAAATVTIDALGAAGDGLAEFDGHGLVVPDALPGDEVELALERKVVGPTVGPGDRTAL